MIAYSNVLLAFCLLTWEPVPDISSEWHCRQRMLHVAGMSEYADVFGFTDLR